MEYQNLKASKGRNLIFKFRKKKKKEKYGEKSLILTYTVIYKISSSNPADIYLFKVNNRNTKKM